MKRERGVVKNKRNWHPIQNRSVAFYCKDTFQCDARADSPRSTLELICVEITPPKAKPFVVILWYRPPSNPIDDFDKLEQVLRFFESEGKEIILLGDTNCDLLH